jgi:hypothetical protein
VPYKDPEKQRLYQQQHFQDNKEVVAQRKRDRRSKAKQYMQAAKTAPCTDCNMTFPHYVMDFDHIANDKIKGLSVLAREGDLAGVITEMAKCELVCANCHRIRSWKRMKNLPL